MTAYGAKVVEHIKDPNMDHDYSQDWPAKAINGLYSNIPGAAMKTSDFIMTDDPAWKTKGEWNDFDQQPFIEEALDEYSKISGQDPSFVDHRLMEGGSYFVPSGCKQENSTTKCKVMILLHGCGGDASGITE